MQIVIRQGKAEDACRFRPKQKILSRGKKGFFMSDRSNVFSSSQKDVIIVNHLEKRFVDVQHASLRQLIQGKTKGIEVLNDISFRVQKGELLGVIGRNGAGKSTLLRLLANVYRPTGGTISVGCSPSTLFEMGTFLDANASGRKYCRDYFEFLQFPTEEIQILTNEIEEFIEIGQFFDKPVRSYSSGMKARLLFAVATARKSDIYLIDEALVVGDEYFQGKAWKKLYELLQNGASGVIVTHDMDSIIKLCENCIYLKDGRIAYSGKSYLAVNEYLGLSSFQNKDVYLLDKSEMGIRSYSHTSGDDYVFDFSYQILEAPSKGILTIAFSIEKRLTYGGVVHVCKMDNNVSAIHKGVYDFSLTICELDLTPGEYFCTLTLGDPPEGGEGPFHKIYDEKRWIHLIVSGKVLNEDTGEKPLLQKQGEWSIKCL